MIDILLDSLLDTLKLIPFLYLSYLFIEYIEHKASDKITGSLYKMGRLGPVVGAAVGIIPMCGLSVSAVDLFANRLISAGTLAALLISCSDEALPVLLGTGGSTRAGLLLILCKLIIGTVAGLLLDVISKDKITPEQAHEKHEFMHRDCDEDECEKEGIFLTALIHTLTSSAFVFGTLVFLGLAIEVIGEDTLASALTTHRALAPLVSSLIGLIPNCAPSYLLSELHIEGLISFGAMLAGLTVNSGVGLAVLWKQNRNTKQNLLITSFLFIISVIIGVLVQMLFG